MPYWLTTPLLLGEKDGLQDGEIAIIGSGLTGVSVAYWLQRFGLENITIIDTQPEKMASARNCGHILYGTVESMQALTALHGKEVAKEIWSFSIRCCEQVQETIQELNLACDYRRDGYYVIAIDDAELKEIHQSIQLLNSMGFQSDFVDREALLRLGFRNVCGARFEQGSSAAHPVQFRNGLLAHVLARGAKYYSSVSVSEVSEEGEHAVLQTSDGEKRFTIAVLATSAYSPLLSPFFRNTKLIEPFKGQIITSAPLKHHFPVKGPHSFDHGYEYALVTQDNRLMIGGWRNMVEGKEVGTYDLRSNPAIDRGLQHFVAEHYSIAEEIPWEYSWTGIMDSSQTGFPFIGPIGYRLFTSSGYTGHGFSWAHGSSKLLAEMICDQQYDRSIAKYFNPRALA